MNQSHGCLSRHEYQSPSFLDPKKDDVILDIGAGTGYISSKVCELCDEVYALEPSVKKVEFIRRKFPQVKVFVGTCDKIPFPEFYFDKVFIISAFHHFPDQNDALEDISRVLKDDGLLLLQERNPRGVGVGQSLESIVAKNLVKFLRPYDLEDMVKRHRFMFESLDDGSTGYFLRARKTRTMTP